jgi:hypothetical protein
MRLGSILGRAGETVLQDFEKGFKQIQTDLRYLSRTVAVTYPLVEYFVLDGHIANVDEAYDFIELVIWRKDEQKQEVMRVAYAAFGAIGSFAMAKVFTSDAVPRITGAANNTASEATTGQPSDRSVVPSYDRSPTQPASAEPTAAPQHATPPSAEPNLPGSQPPAEPGQRLHA